MIDNLNEKVIALTDLVEEMIKIQQVMHNKIEFLEKRINLIEKVDEYQDKELNSMENKIKNIDREYCGMSSKLCLHIT